MDTRIDSALEQVAARLGAYVRELQDAGVRHLSIFGMDVPEAKDADAEIDVAADLDPAARIDLISLSELEFRLAEIAGCKVALYPEPLESARLQARVDRGRHRVF
jgi:predicted nucleotidyltransferase